MKIRQNSVLWFGWGNVKGANQFFKESIHPNKKAVPYPNLYVINGFKQMPLSRLECIILLQSLPIAIYLGENLHYRSFDPFMEHGIHPMGSIMEFGQYPWTDFPGDVWYRTCAT